MRHSVSHDTAADARALAALLDSSQDAIISWGETDAITGWNRGAERLFGYSREAALGRPATMLWPREVQGALENLVARLHEGEDVAMFETRHIRRDGGTVDVSATITAVRDAGGGVIGVTSIVRDISKQKRAERMLAEERTRWVTAFRNAPIGMALVDLDGHWLAVNRELCRLMQRDEDVLLATDLGELTHPDDLGSDAAERQRAHDGEIDGYEVDRRYRLPDGGTIWTHVSVALVRGIAHAPLYYVLQIQDVTARKEAEAELARYVDQLGQLARQDPVTGLPNFREFSALVDTELKRGERYGGQWSIVLFDIDDFKLLNEHSHARGNHGLRETAQAIARACRASDSAARVGADEFALILPGIGESDAHAAAKRVATAVARTGAASLSFGVATWPDDGNTIELLLLRANLSLQSAKSGAGSSDRSGAGDPERPGRPADMISELVGVAKQFLGMDVAYLSEVDEVSQTLNILAGDSESFGLACGVSIELESTYCQRMLAHRVPHAVPDVTSERELASLPVTRQAGIGSYLGVPVMLGNGHIYGTLCAISHDRTPGLDEHHVDLMHRFAGLIASHLEHDAEAASARRVSAERTGMNALLSTLTARDHYTGEHSESVVELASTVAFRLGLGAEQIREVEQVALLHDIGKVGIPDAVLQKRGPLTDEEWELMRQHPAVGGRILAGIPTLAHLAPAVTAEHERFDGQGYPDGLSGTEIPLASRIVFACDAYHAITSDRPYRRALDAGLARQELASGAGTQFDPTVIRILLEILKGGAVPDGEAEPAVDRAAYRDVLSAAIPSQLPEVELTAVTRAGPVARTRAACQRCGSHTPIVVTRAAVGGSCTNCGSYDLRPILRPGA